MSERHLDTAGATDTAGTTLRRETTTDVVNSDRIDLGSGATSRTTHDNDRRHERRWDDLAVGEDTESWRARSRIVLTPMAAPSIMGLGGFMIATAMVGAWQAGWYGTVATAGVLWPFALLAGGVMQSIAAVMSFRARDGVAVAVHTAWGSFWVAWGVLQILVTTGLMAPIPFGAANAGFAFWFIGLTMLTLTGMLATMGKNLLLFITLGALTAGAAFTAAGFWAGTLWLDRVGGWLFVVSAAAAWLTVTSMVLAESYGRTILPLGKFSKEGTKPGGIATVPIEYAEGMPGSRVGQ